MKYKFPRTHTEAITSEPKFNFYNDFIFSRDKITLQCYQS